MNLRRVACAVAAVGLMTVGAFAEQKKPAAAKPAAEKGPDMKAMQEAMEKAATPGAQHKMLQGMVGTWTTAGKFWMPGQPKPMEVQGTSECKSALDGRFVTEMHSSTWMGKPFQGMGLMGFDNVSQKFQSTWVDSMGTGIMMTEGTWDEKTKTLTMNGEENSPMGKHAVKFVTKIENDKKHVMEMFAPGPDGKEMKAMEITYTKK
jgi:Protein of unknown function (DUF1579)